VPTGLIHQRQRVSTGSDGKRYLGKVHRHGFGIAEGPSQASAFAAFRTDCAEDKGRFRPLVLRRRRPSSAFRPAPRDLVFLTDAGFVLT
jgi:hypothetical protein